MLLVHVRDCLRFSPRLRVFFDSIFQCIVDEREVGIHSLQPRILCLQVLQAFEVVRGEAAGFGLPVIAGDIASPVASLMPISRQGPGFSPRSLRLRTEMILASLNCDVFIDQG